jgi:hypothetical protein
MVVIFLPATAEIGVMQEREASPLICTVQALHSAMPQPNFVPVMLSVSRSTQSRGICGQHPPIDFPFNERIAMIASRRGKVRSPT